MSIVFIPLYIKYLGIEAYGLIGIFAILQACLTLLDLGMTPTLNREMARYTAGEHSRQVINDLLRTLEVICFFVASIIVFLILISAKWLSSDWLKVSNLPIEQVRYAISIMGLVVAFRFIESLYRGALLGLQRHVLFNVVNSFMSTLRNLGVLGVMVWYSPTIEAFFFWHAIISILTIVVFKIFLHQLISHQEVKPKFSFEVLKGVWRFAGSMILTSLLSLLLLQTDKILLSRLLSLESFGYYTLAASVAGVLYMLASPVSQSFYPRFTELVVKKQTDLLIETYHGACQLVTVIIMPIAFLLLFFGKSILLLWVNDPTLVMRIYPIVVLLVIGAALNALAYIPYMLQLSYGWANFAVVLNSIAVLILVPSFILITPIYGVLGAAAAWALLNIGYLFFSIHFMHMRLVPKEKWTWYIQDILLPSLASCVVVVLFVFLHPSNDSKIFEFFWLITAGCVAFIASVYAASKLRKRVFVWSL